MQSRISADEIHDRLYHKNTGPAKGNCIKLAVRSREGSTFERRQLWIGPGHGNNCHMQQNAGYKVQYTLQRSDLKRQVSPCKLGSEVQTKIIGPKVPQGAHMNPHEPSWTITHSTRLVPNPNKSPTLLRSLGRFAEQCRTFKLQALLAKHQRDDCHPEVIAEHRTLSQAL